MPHILFIIQNGNCQSRSLLVPEEEFLKVRKDDLEILRKNTVSFRGIKGVIFIDYIREGNCSHIKKTEYTNFCSDLEYYADWSKMEDCYIDLKDKEWADKSLKDFCGGFNHIKNFLEFKNAKKILDKDVNIVEAFLILETRDGVFEDAFYDTVDDMMEDIYGFRPSDVKKLLEDKERRELLAKKQTELLGENFEIELPKEVEEYFKN